MKRLDLFAVILLIICIVVFALTGCSGPVSEEVNNQEFGTQEVDTNNFGVIDYYDFNYVGDRIYYVYDKDTKVEYIIVVYAAGYKGGISITPRYNADGTLKIHE